MKYIAICGNADSAVEAIGLSALALYEKGYVTEAFARDCIVRENEYPTGIPSEIPVALPHCFTNSILADAICYLRLSEPVKFMRMDDDQSFIETRHVFNLAVTRDNQLAFLSDLVQKIQDKGFMRCLDGMDIERVPTLLKKALG